jgi:hypothetical protein
MNKLNIAKNLIKNLDFLILINIIHIAALYKFDSAFFLGFLWGIINTLLSILYCGYKFIKF